MDFELAVFFLFMGGLMALAFIGIGVILGYVDRRDKEQHGISDNQRFLPDDGSRMGSGNNGHDMEMEGDK